MTLDVLRILRGLPTAAQLISAAEQAARGDEQALHYLKSQGWADALDAFVKPGAGDVSKRAVSSVREFIRGDVIDAEYTVLENQPWNGFISRLFNTPSGGHILLGSPGTGKTTLAIKLASRWAQKLGYKVEFCNVYPDDLPDFGNVIHIDTLIDRMAALGRWLKAQAVSDNDEEAFDVDGDTQPAKASAGTAKPPPAKRVIVIDEAGLSLGNTAFDAGRRAALQALAQSRHAKWIVLYLAQWAGQLPLPLLGLSTVWVKEPQGDEADTDRDNPVVRDLWREAEGEFAKVKRSNWYAGEYADPRAWAYVKCRTLLGKPGYTGMIPCSPYDPSESNATDEVQSD